MMIGGRGANGWQTGIAYGTDLRSGAIATTWNLTPGSWSSSFNISHSTFLHGYGNFTSTVQADVINSSWGMDETTGSDFYGAALDAFAAQHPQTTFVLAAGNSGPSGNSVASPASGWNGISVGALANDGNNNYNTIADFSSRGPQDYYDPVNGVVEGVRAAVDLVAPGSSLSSAYYGGRQAETRETRPTAGQIGILRDLTGRVSPPRSSPVG